jgi:hypothetical protein
MTDPTPKPKPLDLAGMRARIKEPEKACWIKPKETLAMLDWIYDARELLVEVRDNPRGRDTAMTRNMADALLRRIKP